MRLPQNPECAIIFAHKLAFNTLLCPCAASLLRVHCSDKDMRKLPRAICLQKNMGQHNPMIFPSVNILWLNKVLLKSMKQAASHTPLCCLISHVLILLTLVLPVFQLYDIHKVLVIYHGILCTLSVAAIHMVLSGYRRTHK